MRVGTGDLKRERKSRRFEIIIRRMRVREWMNGRSVISAQGPLWALWSSIQSRTSWDNCLYSSLIRLLWCSHRLGGELRRWVWSIFWLERVRTIVLMYTWGYNDNGGPWKLSWGWEKKKDMRRVIEKVSRVSGWWSQQCQKIGGVGVLENVNCGVGGWWSESLELRWLRRCDYWYDKF